MNFIIEKIGERSICIKGIGRMFYEHGVPISMIITKLSLKGVEVSLFHVADECMKNGWTAKTTYNKLAEDFQDSNSETTDFNKLQEFCFASYERQREMIFDYLFVDVASAKSWLRNKV